MLKKLLEIVACRPGAVTGPLIGAWRARRLATARIIVAEVNATVPEIAVKVHEKAGELASTDEATTDQ